MKKAVKVNSRWKDSDSNCYQIIHVITDDEGHEWVHYRREEHNPREYSCWTDSFLQRFTEIVNEQYR